MFKLNRQKTAGDRSPGEKHEFKFSQFIALQVPQGWDKLFLSIVSTETGKTVAKSGKSVARGGTCQWTDTLSYPIFFCRDKASKELEECVYKIVVSVSSARPTILGEVVLNLTDYISMMDSGSLQLPLTNCNYGTILQVRIQCLPPKIKTRDGKSSMKVATHLEDMNTNSDDVDNKSDVSDNMSKRSGGSFSSNHLNGASYPDETGNREGNFSASGSHRSSDSGGSSAGRNNFSPSSSLNGGIYNLVGRQDSSGSHKSAAYRSVPGDEIPRSNHSSFNSRLSGSPTTSHWMDISAQTSGHATVPCSVRSSDSPNGPLETAEEAFEELRDEAKMWERHARKLKHDLEFLKKELSEKSKHQADVNVKLSAAYSERDSLKEELEQVKCLLEQSRMKYIGTTSSNFEDIKCVQKELEDELKFQKESNSSLSLQLKKTQESNLELVSILQELEEMVENQRAEIANLSTKSKVIEPKGDLDQKLMDLEAKWAQKLSANEKEKAELEGKLSQVLSAQNTCEGECDKHYDLVKEIELLKAKVQELEKDCTELTDENLDLLYKMNELQKDTGEANISRNSSNNDLKHFTPTSSDEMTLLLAEVNKQLLVALAYVKCLSGDAHYESSRYPDSPTPDSCMDEKDQAEALVTNILELNESLRAKVVEHKQKAQNNSSVGNQIEQSCTGEENSSKSLGQLSEIEELKAACSAKDTEIGSLKVSQKKLEDVVLALESDKKQLEDNLKTAHTESSITSKCLDDVQRDFMVFTNRMEATVSANKILERKSTELEGSRQEMELRISDLEDENTHLSDSISELKAQMGDLTTEKESYRLELEGSRSLVMELKDEISRHRSEIEDENLELKDKLEESHKELEVLKTNHTKALSTIEDFIEECTSLHKLIGDLKSQNLELHKHNSHVGLELSLMQKNNADFLKKMELLEQEFSSLQEDTISKETSLISQMETMLEEQKAIREKIDEAHSMLNKLDLEKAFEIENLQKELTHLMEQTSSTDDVKIASQAINEVSVLQSQKAKLESGLHEAHARIKIYESELHNHQQESSAKVQELLDMLNASKQNEEKLMSDADRMRRIVSDVKSSEESFKKKVNEIEEEHKTSDNEKQLLTEEISSLKLQLQSFAQLQDEILALKVNLDDEKFEKQKLEESLRLVTGECKELKMENDSLIEKLSCLPKDFDRGEDARQSRIALEEKLLRLNEDLTAREALDSSEAELKNELECDRKTKSECERKVEYLEEEKVELMRKAEALEKEVTLTKEQHQNPDIWSEERKMLHGPDGNLKNVEEADFKSRIYLLETELAEAVETNNMYKLQLERLLNEKRSSDTETCTPVCEKDTSDQASRISQLETELKDMRERYLQMSLQYAEVEAQREEMVLKLKSAKKDRRWFT